MRTKPLRPATIEFGSAADEPPRSPEFDDLYHPRIGALAQAQHVFLQGNGLPLRWAGRDRFVILETGFGLGNNFLATWRAWRDDPARCERLCFVSIEARPPTASDLARAHRDSAVPELAAALLASWPPLTPNLHSIDLDGARVQLLLAFGDVTLLLPALSLQADAFFLDGFAPARNPAMWQPRVLKALGRKAADGATLATWSVARDLRDGLSSAGFEVERAPGIGGKREITVARWAPRVAPRAAMARVRPAVRSAGTADAVVVGAGIAGAAVAQALARQGRRVTVLERLATPAAGLPGGIFHGSVHGDDGVYARLFRAAALEAQRGYSAALATGGIAGQAQGLLSLQPQFDSPIAMQGLLTRLGLPAAYVQAVDASAASALAGLPLSSPAWHYPGGGWIAPGAWVRLALSTPGVLCVGAAAVAKLTHEGGQWQARSAAGAVLAAAPQLVLACSHEAPRLLDQLGHAPWPVAATLGQVSFWTDRTANVLRLPLTGDGYVLPLAGGGLLCGATRRALRAGDALDAGPPSASDDLSNLERLRRLAGLGGPADPSLVQSRTGSRLQAQDRLPIAGALPALSMAADQRMDQARLLPRDEGLFALTALGSRGLTLAPLLARLLAAQMTGSPLPLEQDLVDAVDPGRWLVRRARQASRSG